MGDEAAKTREDPVDLRSCGAGEQKRTGPEGIDMAQSQNSPLGQKKWNIEWSDLKIQLAENEGFSQLYGKIVQLKLESSDGKKYLTDTANTEKLQDRGYLAVIGWVNKANFPGL